MPGRIFTSNLGKVLATLLIIGVAGSTVSYGTFASFTAQTTNAGNTFSTGTLVLSNKKDSASACFSSAGGVDTNSRVCDVLFTAANMAPGGSATTTTVVVRNEGTLAGSALKLWSSGCDALNNTTGGNTVWGSGNPCNKMMVTVQEATAGCVYPTTGGTCSASTSGTLTALVSAGELTARSGGLPAGTAATYTFAVYFDPAADNLYQGKVASTTFNWRLDQ
jgi:hypothetical protein